MKIRKEHIVVLLVAVTVVAQALNTQEVSRLFRFWKNTPSSFHSFREREVLNQRFSELKITDDPIQPGEYFLTSGSCRGCHGRDSLQYANVDNNGIDINVYDDWIATMMANSAKDPLWRAKVSHEILVNPAHSLQLQNKCTSCHAPMGHYTSFFQGNPYYTLANLYTDSLGLDGVSCTGCHTIGPNQLGSLFSGNIPYDTNHVIYGPYVNPIQGPMQLYVGYTPVFSAHMDNAQVCSPCHTLIAGSVDLNGNYTGRQFVEQATYHEWVNSVFSADFISCQNCHMPRISDSVVIANGYLNMPPRAPFNRHMFNGANEFMMKLMKDNKTALGISATDKNYDSTLAVTKRLLTRQTLNLNLSLDSIRTDTAFFRVRLTNKAGHKFPSGYPSRRAVLQFVVVGSFNDTIFQSGLFDPQFEVIGIDPQFEPHYQVISNPSEAQIYEMVAGDVNGHYTTVLERMDIMLKDNRLPPEGFTTTSSVYDTVKIVGHAETDPDFNLTSGGVEGTGMDFVYYHIPVTGHNGPFNVYTRVYYQPVPPGYLAEMFAHSSTEIDAFRNMYNQADKSPSLVASDSLLQVSMDIPVIDWNKHVKVYPDPTADGWINVQAPEENQVEMIRVFGLSGQVIATYTSSFHQTLDKIQLPEEKGTYIVEIWLDHRPVRKKVIRN